MSNRIILPLDDLTWDKALPIMKQTAGLVWGYKVRKIILEKGIDIISEIKEFGNVMLDFKLYDIPSAMQESLTYHFEKGADLSTIHCSSLFNASDMSKEHKKKIVGVTVLTSFGKEWYSYQRPDWRISKFVENMAVDMITTSNVGNIVCSPLELEVLKNLPIKKITPGIRPEWYSTPDDQNRTSTPEYAIKNGSDYLVIGRPILKANNITDAVKMTNDEINKSL